MKKTIKPLFLLLLTAVAGCSTMPVVEMGGAPIPSNDNVKFMDERTSPSSEPYMFAEGNIYSCHYGIKKIGAEAMQPDRMKLLHSYLDNQILKGAELHTTIVKRFDIYWNRDVVLRYHAGLPFALAGYVAASAATSGLVIGCKDAEEGEYYSAEVPGKDYSAIVIYIDILIDSQSYKVRTVYPVLEDTNTKARWPSALAEAVKKTFATLGSMVERDESITSPSPN